MNEFTIEVNIDIAHQFIQENFVNRGMICDWAFHLPEKEEGIQNPHIHLMCPIRPMNKDGTRGQKQISKYHYDNNGEIQRDEKGRKIYDSVKTTDWSDSETLIEWRKAWADINNKKFEEKGLNVRISELSLEEQGLDMIPTIHEGPAVREMEKRGIRTDKGDFNRWVRKTNTILSVIREYFSELFEWIKQIKHKDELKPGVLKFISDYYTERGKSSYTNKLKAENLKNFADSISYLESNNISTVDDLQNAITKNQMIFNNGNAKRKAIREDIREYNMLKGRLKSYHANKVVGETYEKKVFFKEQYYKEHKKEIDRYFGCKKKIPEKWLMIENWEEKIDKRIINMTNAVETYSEQLEPIKAELNKLKQIKWCVDVASGTVNPNAEEKKLSLNEKLEKYKAEIKANEKKKAPAKRQECER